LSVSEFPLKVHGLSYGAEGRKIGNRKEERG
jgi:hypothetical protein